ncbi:Pre-rRNA-processing protein fhl1 [Orbilia blumenaviensis]|uniref:Pre-rRNA-processing protein fhl1 n=1 Tax=Orbilia blumenaviensis TaxID=1796055 RepID=A0AAV9U284_9PEZI
MADVEQHYGQKEGRVTDGGAVKKQQQIMTPCPSPDEAMFVGEDRAEEQSKARLSTGHGDAVPNHNNHDDSNDNNINMGHVAASTTTAAIAATDTDTDHHGIAARRESTAAAVVTTNGVNTMATSPAESAHSNAINDDAMVVTTDDASAPIPSDHAKEQPLHQHQQQRKTSPDSITKAIDNDDDAKQVPVDDAGFLDPLDHNLDLSNIDIPASTIPMEDLIMQVDGGAWFPTNPGNGVTPRIEAFAKLEFHYGQDFYLSGLNIVLGRQDKESISSFSKKKRKSENHFGDSILSLDEVKVPLFPPPEIDISSISRRHLRIQYDYEASSWTLTSLCDTGFRLIRGKYKPRGYPNGKRATLENSDIIQFGNLSFTWFLPDQDESRNAEVEEDVKMEDVDILGEGMMMMEQEVSSGMDTDNDSDDGDDEDEGSDLDSREASHDVGTPTPRTKLDGTDDSSLMPPPPTVKRGRGRPPKNGISVREQKLLKRQAQEEFLANGGNVAGLDMTKYGSLPVDQLFAREGEKMQMQMEKEARRKQKMEEKEAKIREKQAAKDLKPVKIPKERKRKRTKSPPAREEDYTPEQLAKPQLPYTVMIFDAINNSEKKALTLPEIYRSLENSYPYFKVRAETTGWQSSVRHNLRGSGEGGGSSLFKRGPKSGKGYIWELVEGANIDKERKKRKPVTGSPHPAQASIQSAAGQMVPSGSWGQGTATAAAGGGHYVHPNQFAQQYQPVQGGIQGYAQATYQAATAPSTPVVNRAPPSNGSGSVTPRAAHVEGGVVPQHRPSVTTTPVPPPPPTWNPTQQPKPTHVATNTAQIPQQMRSAVSVQTQAPLRQVVAPSGGHPPKVATHHQVSMAAAQTASGVPLNRPASGIHTASTVPKLSTSASLAVDSKAKDLLDNPIFLNIMKEHIRKNPTNNINSPEVRKALWAEFKKTSGSKASLIKSVASKVAAIPKPGVTAATTTPVDVAQLRSGLAVQPTHNAIGATSAAAAAAPIPVAKPVVPQVPMLQRVSTLTPQHQHQHQQTKPQQQVPTTAAAPTAPMPTKPATPGSSLPQRTNALLTGLKLDAKRRLEFLQVLKNAKEKKAAEAMGQAKSGGVGVGSAVKRSAEGVPEGAPQIVKRVVLEGQQ